MDSTISNHVALFLQNIIRFVGYLNQGPSKVVLENMSTEILIEKKCCVFKKYKC